MGTVDDGLISKAGEGVNADQWHTVGNKDLNRMYVLFHRRAVGKLPCLFILPKDRVKSSSRKRIYGS